jgi:peptidoglycan hydrolase-like protein with peptidoglycan-binding domain
VNSGPILSIGSAGPDVRRLQIIFVMTKVLDVTDIDSQFGPKTQDAVKSFQQGNNLYAGWGGGTADVASASFRPKYAPTSTRVDGTRCVRIAKGAKGVRRSKHTDRPWANRRELWSENRISRACLSNSAKHRSRRSCWRPDLVGSCRCSWGHAGKISWPRHCVISWRQPERLNRRENLSTSQSQQKAAPVHVQYTRPVASRTERQPRTSYTDP